MTQALLKTSRQQQKAETRQKLLDAAAAELASGRSFDTLSLREVAKLAGIAPTSFYRHFHDMEGLGLTLVEQCGESLRKLIHDVLHQASNGRSLIRASVETLFAYFHRNQGISRMILQESISRQPEFRRAAERLMQTMASDLADYLEEEARERGVPLGHARLAADSMVAILFTAGIALLDTPDDERDQHVETAIIQLRMIMRGAEAMGQI
ncbi:MAG: HTH-type transcriptional repressor FabR [Gammaproteobacteria bacterium]|nr:HTH-type transcriptional repressor FabR [Gammaproteobacteria bacterium]